MAITSRAGFISGICGGLLSGAFTFAALNYFFSPGAVPTAADAIAIANTYIVFTTIIFVAITLFLTVAGLWFTQQFATSKELQIRHLISDIEAKLNDNTDDLGIKLVDKAFANSDVSRHVQSILETKLEQLLDQAGQRARNEQDAAAQLSAMLKR